MKTTKGTFSQQWRMVVRMLRSAESWILEYLNPKASIVTYSRSLAPATSEWSEFNQRMAEGEGLRSGWDQNMDPDLNPTEIHTQQALMHKNNIKAFTSTSKHQ